MKFALDAADEKPEGKIFLIPARLEECTIPDRLKQLHCVDLFDLNGYERLLKALAAQGAHISSPVASAKLRLTVCRLTVHKAFFLPNGPECYFINATNRTSQSALVVTHVWFATTPEIHMAQKDRPLPKRLEPQETWETWIRVAMVPNSESGELLNLARARLATGKIVHSHYNEVPTQGTVPGGPITKVED